MIWPWPDLTWGQIFNLTFQSQKVHISNRLDGANRMVSFLFSYLPYQKSYWWKTISVKNDNFHSMTSGAKTIDLWSNLIRKIIGAWGELPNAFFEFLLAIILLDIITIVCEKSLFSRNLTLGDLWWPQYWLDLKMTCIKAWYLVAVYLMPLTDCR